MVPNLTSSTSQESAKLLAFSAYIGGSHILLATASVLVVNLENVELINS